MDSSNFSKSLMAILHYRQTCHHQLVQEELVITLLDIDNLSVWETPLSGI